MEARCDRWFILSAKHGLVDPDARLEPYDETLKDKSRREREAWSARVADDLVERLGAVDGTTFEIHAGSEYRDHGLVEGLRRLGGRVEVPTQGMGIGRQLAFYSVVFGPEDPMDTIALLSALRFAAHRHRDHRRKDREASPYINHPIEVAEILARHGNAANTDLLQAAILHDTIEDTDATGEEIENEFGSAVRRLVEEVTDDKTLPKQERKQLQIEHAPHLSPEARQLKIADKICNVRDLTHSPPPDWPHARRAEYLAWARRVVDGCKGVNPDLDREFAAALSEGEASLGAEPGGAS